MTRKLEKKGSPNSQTHKTNKTKNKKQKTKNKKQKQKTTKTIAWNQ